MSLKILAARGDIRAARQRLTERGVSALDTSPTTRFRRLIRDLGLARPFVLGDQIKSWDVAATLDFIEARVGREQPILDLGCYASEILPVLKAAGYRALAGIDFDSRVAEMPFADEIDWRQGDFMATPFADGSFAAITAVSVIEHGFDGERLFAEVSRLLEPGGHFVASFDYWPDKIDTSDTRLFGLDWRIFSREEAQSLIDEAAKHGLGPTGEFVFEASERAVRHAGRRYTFAWLALQKAPPCVS